MKTNRLYIVFLMLGTVYSYSQKDTSDSLKHTRNISIEPGIGISPMPIVDMSISNIIQWSVKKGVDLLSYTSWKENNIFLRDFNYIKGSNNHSISQKFGAAISLKTKRSSHSIA
ncbi:MAG: hypothetical protein JNL60_09000 [Bacteroidia bacterium]|nr:hypothetical protein [Bacteroidia bacterium]